MKIDVRVDGQAGQLEWDRDGDIWGFSQDGYRREAEVVSVEPGIYSVLLGDKSFEVKIVPGPEGSWFVDLDERHYAVELTDPREHRSTARGRSAEGRQSLKASMPGKVVRVLAEVGDTVDTHQGIVVVEAMKMQNEVKSPRPGKVVQLVARIGATVAAGEVLAIIE
jgi:acetyl/propionyl-CoA carboxylase alpha subunit